MLSNLAGSVYFLAYRHFTTYGYSYAHTRKYGNAY